MPVFLYFSKISGVFEGICGIIVQIENKVWSMINGAPEWRLHEFYTICH